MDYDFSRCFEKLSGILHTGDSELAAAEEIAPCVREGFDIVAIKPTSAYALAVSSPTLSRGNRHLLRHRRNIRAESRSAWPQTLEFFLLIIPAVIVLLLFTENVLAHSWMAPKDAAEKRNPTPLSAVSVSRGKEIYQQNCAHCHGENLKGLSPSTTGLQQNSPDLRQRLKTHTEGDFHWKIQNGKGEMPSFKEDLSEKEIWDVINFINSMGT